MLARPPRTTTSTEDRPTHAVRRALLIMAASAMLAFGIVATATVFVAHAIARHTALAEAERSARSMADTVFVPALPGAIRRDPASIATLQRAVAARKRSGAIVRVKVWTRDGRVVFSDEPSIVGHRFDLGKELELVIDNQVSKSDLSNLDEAENVAETGQFNRLVEVYTPITLEDGTQLAFETYSTDARVSTAEHALVRELVPLSLGSLVILLIAQLPISMWLVRRVGAAQQERGRLLNNSLIASARERRQIARELHDGVVQDLAGVGYAVGALAQSMHPGAGTDTARTLDRVSGAVQDSVARLRTLMVDIYPPDLSSDGLRSAIEGLVIPLRGQGILVDVDIELSTEPAPEVAATLYRCAREALTNVVKHADATHVTVNLTGDARTVVLRVQDDGRGVEPADLDRRAEGHLGLQLLRDAAKDLGGELSVVTELGAGTGLTLWLPVKGIPSH
ncbi:MAG: two-component system, NarL family, sensor kinase [Pseudonocardiales bacterium]|nr:two-component system, NarL family, sensor kinase [Pseudonocardiales bacterium]